MKPNHHGHHHSLKVTSSGQSQTEGHHYGSFKGTSFKKFYFQGSLELDSRNFLWPPPFLVVFPMNYLVTLIGLMYVCSGQSCRSLAWDSEALQPPWLLSDVSFPTHFLVAIGTGKLPDYTASLPSCLSHSPLKAPSIQGPLTVAFPLVLLVYDVFSTK